MDGTFRVAPTLFSQLYTIHVYKKNTMLCVAYFLLPNKEKNTYNRMLQILQGKCALGATSFQVDFEQSAIAAVKQVFPAARVHGCFFHFTQCVWKKVRN